MRHFSRTTHYINFEDLELPVEHEPVGYIDPLVERVGNKIVLGYLSHDNDCTNPLEDCDGLGHIYFMGRRGSRDDEQTIYRALGLNQYGDPDLDQVEQDAVHAYFKDRLIKDSEFYLKAVRMLKTDPLRVDWYTLNNAYSSEEGNLISSAEEEDAFRDQWEKDREAGKIGDRDTVVLDVYEHSGMAVSISGEGTQCRWDTSRGGALWLPDDEAREEIDRRAARYRYGTIKEVRLRDTQIYQIHPWEQGFRHIIPGRSIGAYPSRRKAEQALELLKDSSDVVIAPEKLARETAAEEICRSTLEQFNAWLAGECYGICVEVFEVEGDKVTQVAEDACWGIIGHKWAEESLQAEFDPEVKRLREAQQVTE